MAERGVASRSRSKSQINRRVSKKGICICIHLRISTTSHMS